MRPRVVTMWKLRVLLTAVSFVLGSAATTSVVVAQENGSATGEVEHESEVNDHADASHDGESHGSDGAGQGSHGASAHGGGPGSTNPLSVDPDLALFTLIIFCAPAGNPGQVCLGTDSRRTRSSREEHRRPVGGSAAEQRRGAAVAERARGETRDHGT